MAASTFPIGRWNVPGPKPWTEISAVAQPPSQHRQSHRELCLAGLGLPVRQWASRFNKAGALHPRGSFRSVQVRIEERDPFVDQAEEDQFSTLATILL